MSGRTIRNSALLIAGLMLAACTHQRVSLEEPARVEPNRDYVIRAAPSTVAPGQSLVLQWKIPGATSVSIDATGVSEHEHQHLGTFEGSGELRVTPAEDTTYVVTCEGSTSITCASVSVKVRVTKP